MKRLIAACAALALLAAAPLAGPAQAQDIEVSELQSRGASVGTNDKFTGTALIEPLFSPREPTRTSAARVTFVPGARTAWHSHPRGQTLVVTSGSGWVERRDGSRREIEAGDVVWTPPGVEHWHGATESNAMSHIAVQEQRGGTVVNWGEKVTDEEYQSE